MRFFFIIELYFHKSILVLSYSIKRTYKYTFSCLSSLSDPFLLTFPAAATFKV